MRTSDPSSSISCVSRFSSSGSATATSMRVPSRWVGSALSRRASSSLRSATTSGSISVRLRSTTARPSCSASTSVSARSPSRSSSTRMLPSRFARRGLRRQRLAQLVLRDETRPTSSSPSGRAAGRAPAPSSSWGGCDASGSAGASGSAETGCAETSGPGRLRSAAPGSEAFRLFARSIGDFSTERPAAGAATGGPGAAGAGGVGTAGGDNRELERRRGRLRPGARRRRSVGPGLVVDREESCRPRSRTGALRSGPSRSRRPRRASARPRSAASRRPRSWSPARSRRAARARSGQAHPASPLAVRTRGAALALTIATSRTFPRAGETSPPTRASRFSSARPANSPSSRPKVAGQNVPERAFQS